METELEVNFSTKCSHKWQPCVSILYSFRLHLFTMDRETLLDVVPLENLTLEQKKEERKNFVLVSGGKSIEFRTKDETQKSEFLSEL